MSYLNFKINHHSSSPGFGPAQKNNQMKKVKVKSSINKYLRLRGFGPMFMINTFHHYAKHFNISNTESVVAFGRWLEDRKITGDVTSLLLLFFACEVYGANENDFLVEEIN